jgi:hypothetical protein
MHRTGFCYETESCRVELDLDGDGMLVTLASDIGISVPEASSLTFRRLHARQR